MDKEEVPGWKAVKSGGRRYITDGEAAVEKLAEASDYDADSFFQPKKIKGLGDLEKLVGKAGLPRILGDLIQKSEGKLSIVPEDDKRDAWDANADAAKDFADE